MCELTGRSGQRGAQVFDIMGKILSNSLYKCANKQTDPIISELKRSILAWTFSKICSSLLGCFLGEFDWNHNVCLNGLCLHGFGALALNKKTAWWSVRRGSVNSRYLSVQQVKWIPHIWCQAPPNMIIMIILWLNIFMYTDNMFIFSIL